MQTFSILCAYCKKASEKPKNQLAAARRRGQTKFYCNQSCKGEAKKASTPFIEASCSNCSKEFKRMNSRIQKSNRLFCSRSCAVSFNNKIPKKKRTKQSTYCRDCQATIRHGNKRCDQCRRTYQLKILSMPKSALSGSEIRRHARQMTKNRIHQCQYCGYAKMVHTCHIKAVKEFGDDIKISVINAYDNLILLCPRHHWEYDHNLISIAGIGIEPTGHPYER